MSIKQTKQKKIFAVVRELEDFSIEQQKQRILQSGTFQIQQTAFFEPKPKNKKLDYEDCVVEAWYNLILVCSQRNGFIVVARDDIISKKSQNVTTIMLNGIAKNVAIMVLSG